MLDNKVRYLQIAFNRDLTQLYSLLPKIPQSSRIFIEAGTPFIKREGIAGIAAIRSLWSGEIVADLKISDGASGEVDLAYQAGATAVTALGSAPRETLDIFTSRCKEFGMSSIIDMLGVDEPLKVLLKLKNLPNIVVLHKGRDEESSRGKTIPYRQVNKIKSKFNILISAAGGIDLHSARSAIFNGANIVIANIVSSYDGLGGIGEGEDIGSIAKEFLKTIE